MVSNVCTQILILMEQGSIGVPEYWDRIEGRVLNAREALQTPWRISDTIFRATSIILCSNSPLLHYSVLTREP
jgi:hypothetical protein